LALPSIWPLPDPEALELVPVALKKQGKILT